VLKFLKLIYFLIKRDEADVIGDRIVVIADGKLKTVGSPHSLKSQFGVGYRLVCTKKPSCDVEKVTNLLRKYICNIEVASNIGTELSYTLEKSNESVFPEMLSDLESNSKFLDIDCFGISSTTLEEVFHR
jgi:ATP-binding cassette, subfamily A (ABC1), member 3